jgi:hypothetical protein
VTSPEGNDYQYNTDPIKLSLVTAKDVSWAAKAILEAVPNTYYKDELQARAEGLAGEA